MSYLSTADIEQVILLSTRDLGGFSVRRALPAAMRQMVGPFIFLDSFGPVRFAGAKASIPGPIRISASPPSPTFSKANCCTGIAKATFSRSVLVKST